MDLLRHGVTRMASYQCISLLWTLMLTTEFDIGDSYKPRVIELRFQANNSVTVRKTLAQTQAFIDDFSITVIENRVVSSLPISRVQNETRIHYKDTESASHIVVTFRNTSGQISGHVIHESIIYFLEPVGNYLHRISSSEGLHVTRVELNELSHERAKRHAGMPPTMYTVELHMLLDSSVWSAFWDVYNSNSVAMTELLYYYSYILNAIDLAYRNIRSLSISVSCIGITIAKTPADDLWLPGGTDANAILRKMEWYSSGKAGDHFMAFTRIGITSGNSSIAGLGNVGAVCRSGPVSVVKANRLESWVTAAHELGHSLGAQHDGNGNSCPAGRNFIMESSPVNTLLTAANIYRFSNCSEQYIRNYISSLGKLNCLTSSQGARVSSLISPQAEGARMSLDQVCRLTSIQGPGKFFKSTEAVRNPATICGQILCTKYDGTGLSIGGLRAPAGTPCGNRKSCNWSGECTPDPSAPEANESCFWGDSWDNNVCNKWKTVIQHRWDTCTDKVKAGCCKTLSGLC